MSRIIVNALRFIALFGVITAVLTFTAKAAPPNQETPRPRFNLEDIPHQATKSNNEEPTKSVGM